jgi:hypothetical protein
MNELNNKLDGLSELVTRIDAKVLEITTKLDELIKALHEYDDDQIQHCEYSGLPSVKMYDEEINKEYGESSFEAFKFTNDYISSLNIEEVERRMDIIGQNGNTGEHYENEIINKPANTNVDKKKRDKRKYYQPKNK